LLIANNLSHSFEGRELFSSLSLEIKPSSTTAIIGVSGSGKSTLLHILSTFLMPRGGTVLYNNIDLYSLSDKDILEIRRSDFAIIFQNHYLFRGFSAMDNLIVSKLLSNQNIDEDMIEKFKINDILNLSIGKLSGGQQQRVSIARAMTKRPKIIFADEPTGNLDKDTAKDVMNVIFEYVYQNNASLFIVTHDYNLANMCDLSYRLENCEFVKWN
jgi:putative ABC transport system ATP-binding protein